MSDDAVPRIAKIAIWLSAIGSAWGLAWVFVDSAQRDEGWDAMLLGGPLLVILGFVGIVLGLAGLIRAAARKSAAGVGRCALAVVLPLLSLVVLVNYLVDPAMPESLGPARWNESAEVSREYE